MMKQKNKEYIVNRFKLINMPLIIVLISILVVSITTFYVSKYFLIQQMKKDGLSLTRQTIAQIMDNHASLETIDEMLEDKIRITARTVIKNEKNLSNEFMTELAKQLDVDELHWHNKYGKELYSNIEEYIGWTAYEGHPLYTFINSTEIELMEDIRSDDKHRTFIKYGAVKNIDGSFIQVGILADKVEKLTERFSYQNIVEKLAKEENVVYALVMDKNLKTIAANDKTDIGVIYDDIGSKTAVFKGKPYTQELYEESDNITVYDINVPLIINDEIIGAVAIGLSMQGVHSSIYKNLVISSIIAIIMFIIFLLIQNKNIIKPINELNKNIDQIDVEKNLKYRIPLVEKDTFLGISYSINKILDKTYTYFVELKENEEELKASNEELEGVLQQIIASEEELRVQYDEIQTYAQKLEDLKQKYDIAIKGSNSAVWEINLKNRTIYISEDFKDIIGMNLSYEEDVNKVLNQILSSEDKEIVINDYIKYKKGEKEEIYNQIRIKDKKGDIKWFLISGKGVYDSKGKLNLINGIALDITKIKKQEEYIQHLADHDPLTGLSNRRRFVKKLKEEIDKGKKGAVILVDLDNFKGINDTLGHVYGDMVLKKIADIFMSIEDEKIFISRFGGDEFIFLINDEEDINKIEEYAKNIIDIFKDKLVINNIEIYVSFSMGITRYPYDSKNVDKLIMNADTAMYKVKYSGKNNYRFFSSEMTEGLKEKIKIEKILREAIREEGFKLMYQPQVHLKTGQALGFEALIRLKNHNISPAVFIPIAEEMGLIMEIGEWVTNEVVNQINIWKNKGFTLKTIAINISPKQLYDEKYIVFLEKILKEKNVKPHNLEIEITESILLEKTEETIEILKKLKKLGVKIALDDFGTGYSSLSYLTFIPVDKIKLDKSINEKFLETGKLKVMDSLISLAHSLNLEVTAEGIEDIEQYKQLKIGGCDYIQGYLFSKPLIVEEIEKIYNYNFLEKYKLDE